MYNTKYKKVLPSQESKKSLADHYVSFLSNNITKIHGTFPKADSFGFSAFQHVS